jgi:CRISPR-associated protein Csy3
MATTTLKTASVLAFERKLDPSDAIFSAGNWDDRNTGKHWPAIRMTEKSVRGTISNRFKTKDQDPSKLDAAIEKPNLQTVDVAMLPQECDTLKASFSLRVLSGAGQPSACNDIDYQNKLIKTVQTYVQTNRFEELAQRYAYNLANGRFLWRNRMGAEQVEIHVSHMRDGKAQATFVFDALQLSLRDFSKTGNAAKDLGELAKLIQEGLTGNEHVLLYVKSYVRLGAGQEVFPSQELILDKASSGKSKTLYSVDGVAGMHSQKLGNAIRCIDDWYEGSDVNGLIAVEPYGSVTTQAKAYRQPKQKADFYTLLDDWMLKDKTPSIEQQHYVMAVLVRGGVFGDSGKE